MPTVEVDIDDGVLSEVDYLAEEEFTNREEAVEKLLAAGMAAYTQDTEDTLEQELMEEYSEMWDPETDTF
jgi:metal-responsive CopG/Arc/MetJ family transcriptional regulator